MTDHQDTKYDFINGGVVNRASGEQVPLDEPVFIFRARDRQALAALDFYASIVRDEAHRTAVTFAADRFAAFRVHHHDRMKEPDTEPTP